MLKTSGLLLFLIILLNFHVGYTQGKLEYFKEFKLKNGIYLTIDDFKNNNPSLPLSAVVDEDKDYLESSLCMKKLEYVQNGEIFELKSIGIWGVCINGEPYIKHVKNGMNGPLTRQCFYKLFSIGSISSYFIHQKEAYRDLWGTPHYSQSKKLDIEEYALDMETGKSFNKKTEAKKIIEIIKKDHFFKDQKIKKKELGMFITNYNKRHPFSISTD